MAKRITFIGVQPDNPVSPFDPNFSGLSPNQMRNPRTGDVLTLNLNRPVFIDPDASPDPDEAQWLNNVIAFAMANPTAFVQEDITVAVDPGTTLIPQDVPTGADGLPPMPPELVPPEVP